MTAGRITLAAVLIFLFLTTSFPYYSWCLVYEASCGPPSEEGFYNIRCNPTTVAIDRIVNGLLTAQVWDDGGKYCNMGSWDDAPIYYGYIYCPSPDKKACQDQLADGLSKLRQRCSNYRVGAELVGHDGSCLRYESSPFCNVS